MYQELEIKKEKIFLEMDIHKFIKCCISRGNTRPGIKCSIHGAKLAQAMIGNYKGKMLDEVNRMEDDLQPLEDDLQTAEDGLQTKEDIMEDDQNSLFPFY